MRIILKIFKRDMKNIFTNPMGIILSVGIVVLAAAYAWINIAANHDPYGSTKNMPVAVIIEDTGCKYKDIEINVGDTIKESLEGNTSINWQFVDKVKGLGGVQAGEYYAAILVPETFSSSLISIITEKFEQPQITYYANEKKNAIATKITDKVVQTVQTTVNQKYVETVVEVLGEAINVVANADGGGEDTISDLGDRITSARDFIKSVKMTVNSFTKVVDASQQITKSASVDDFRKLTSDSQKTIDDTKEAVKLAKSAVEATVGSVDVVLKDAEDTVKTITDKIDEWTKGKKEDIAKNMEKIELILTPISSRLTAVSETLEKINSNLPVRLKSIDALISKIDRVNYSVKNVISVVEQIKQGATSDGLIKELKADIKYVFDALKEVNTEYKNDVKSVITNNVNDAMETLGDLSGIIQSVNNTLPKVQTFVGSVDSLLSAGGDLVGGLNKILDSCDAQLADLSGKLDGLSKSEIINTISNISAQKDTLGTFFACPVQINTDYVYKSSDYGTAMAPFYSTLAIWVGSIILVALFKTEVKKKKELGKVKPHHEYFGRGLTFIVFAIAQGVVICLGDLILLNVQCYHPVMFVFSGACAAVVYSLFIYSVVTAFGDIGKAIAVVLLIIQLSASSGTFPIHVMPQFFQTLYPYTPFTFIINAMRECIFGTYGSDYWLNLLKLTAYIPVALIIGLIFTRIFKKPLKLFEKKIKETDIM